MIVKLTNDRTRRDWLNAYHVWGVWFSVPQTGATWYRCYLPDGTMLVVEEYSEIEHKLECGCASWTSRTEHFYIVKPGEQFDGQIQTEGALLGEIHGLRGEVEMRYPERGDTGGRTISTGNA